MKKNLTVLKTFLLLIILINTCRQTTLSQSLPGDLVITESGDTLALIPVRYLENALFQDDIHREKIKVLQELYIEQKNKNNILTELINANRMQYLNQVSITEIQKKQINQLEEITGDQEKKIRLWQGVVAVQIVLISILILN